MSEIQFREAILQSGMTPPETITPGKWHKFPGVGKVNGNKAGWCRLFDDGTGGVYGCYATGLDEVWQADRGRKWTAEEQAAFRAKVDTDRKEREAEDAKRKAEAREKAANVWNEAKPVPPDHPYLARKGVQPYSLKVSGDGCLIVPVRDGGALHSLQLIAADGSKRFLTSGRISGCYYSIGKPDGVLCVAEGFATAASIREATGHAVAVAFDCGNLKPVAEALRAKLPDVRIVVCADDDHATKGNPGIMKAKEAAAAVGGVVAVPDFGETRPDDVTDFNDLHKLQGLDAVKRCINAALEGGTVEKIGTEPIHETADETIERLAGLPIVEYGQHRAKEAKRLGLPVSMLDKAVQQAQKGQQSTDGIDFDDVTPWPYPVPGDALLSDISKTLHRFIVCKPETAQAAALWVVMTWVIDVVQVAPLAVITAPEMRCGKTELLTFLGKLVHRPMLASNISPAAMFRVIEACRPTLMIDEVDAFMRENEEIRSILNSGHKREAAYVVRTVGDDHTPKQFSTWGAKALAGIGKQAGTLMDRAITLDLRRKMKHEEVERLRYAEPGLFDDLASRLCRFAGDNREAVRRARPELPQVLNDRAQDNWEPLLAIADVAGGEWPEIARKAAVFISGGVDETATIGNELLADILEVFETKRVIRISTKDLIDALCKDDEKSWATFNRGKWISPKQVARRLKEYGIASKQFRDGYEVVRGYERNQFEDAFSRYLPHPPLVSVTPLQTNGDAGFGVTDREKCNVTKNAHVTLKPSNGAGCNGVTDRKGGAGDSEEKTIKVTV